MLHVRYIGPLRELHHKTALAQTNPFRVQFDGNEDWRYPDEHKLKHPETGKFLCYGWHEFPEEHFHASGEKLFAMRHSVFGTLQEFTPRNPPEWLIHKENLWFWEEYILKLDVGDSKATEFHRIRRVA